MEMSQNQAPIHPGKMLQKEFLKPYHITSTKLAKKIGLSVEQINAVINAQESISTDMALRFSQFFGTSPKLWLKAQMKWDVWHLLHGKKE